jgi:hypothetical protein
MPTKVVNFPESTSRSRSQTVNIPNLSGINGVTVNTGNVSHSVNGEDVTVNVSNGSYTRYTTYTPSTTANDYRTTSPGGSASSLPSSVSYNSGGYSGTLTGRAAYVSSGSAAYTDSISNYGVNGNTQATNYWRWNGSSWEKTSTSYSPSSTYACNTDGYCGTLSLNSTSAGAPNPTGSGSYVGQTTSTTGSLAAAIFKGTITKSFPDTRVWRKDYSGTVYGSTQYTYYYAYTVTIDYVDRVKVGVYKVRTATISLEVPLYDPNIGMGGVNQLRIGKGDSIACFDLVPPSDSRASPLRIQTAAGIKAIAKQ